MASIKELQDALLAVLDRALIEYGLRRPARSQSFYGKTPWGRRAFHIAFIKHSDDCDVTADVAVRIDELERLVNANNPRIAESERKKTFSLGAELGNLSEGGQKRWTLAGHQDVTPVASAILATFRNVGLPYIEKYSNPQNAFEAIKANDRPSWLHSPFHGERCKQIIALALLLHRVHELDQLIEECAGFLRSRNDAELGDFLSFAQQIKARAAASP
jgi:hypothetical protein